jgi:CheY-like chemotaxis protein
MCRILVTDDNDLVRQTLRAMLEARGHEVVIAANGQEAIAAIEAAPVDVVILDVVMPVMGGADALDAIRARFPQVSVIVVSAAFTSADGVYQELAAAGVPLLRKPFSSAALMSVIAAQLAKRQAAGTA